MDTHPIRRALALALAAASFGAAAADLPSTPLRTLDGKPVTLAQLAAGKPLVVNLWATWCPPCRIEMPTLADAQLAEDNVRFVFADQGEAAEKVKRFLAPLPGVENVVLDGESRLGEELHIDGLPTTLFYDAKGKLVDRNEGPLTPEALAKKLARLKR